MTSCSEPVLFPYSIYTLDKNDPYDEGSYVIYSCAPGYQMKGHADDIIHMCQQSVDGMYMWIGPEVSCRGRHFFYVMFLVSVVSHVMLFANSGVPRGGQKGARAPGATLGEGALKSI